MIHSRILSVSDNNNDSKIHIEEHNNEDKIRFITEGQQRMIISNSTTSGNIGIGLNFNNPTSTLDIQGDLAVSNKIGIGTSTVETSLDVDSSLKVFDVLNDVSGYINTSSGDYMKLQATSRTDTSTKKYIILNSDGGYVGIGTTSPTAELTLEGSRRIMDMHHTGTDSCYFSCSNDNITFYAGADGIGFTGNTDNAAIGTWSDSHLTFHINSNEKMRIHKNGNVGIGNTNPLGKLTLSNLPYGGTFTAPHGWYNFNHGGVNGVYTHAGATAGSYGVGLYITDHGGKAIIPEVIVGHGINYSSDSRIKTNIIELEDNEALNIFRQLKPCKYNYIDYRGRGTDKVFGFIAQEVKEILPHAVISSKTIGKKIPNIYTFADVNNITLTFHDSVDSYTDDNGNIFSDLIGNTSLFTKDSEDNFDTLIFYSSNGSECRREIVNIIDEKTFEIDNPIESEYIEDNKIFVFGQEVSDFHTLNKDAIWTTATAALQEVDRIQQADTVKIQTLETEVSTLKTQLADLLGRVTALESN